MANDLIELDVVVGVGDEAGPHASDPLRDLPAEVRVAIDPNGTWHVLWRSDVEALLHDRRLRGVGLSFFDLMGITEGPLRDWYSGIMFTNEGPTHHRLRTLVQKAFTPRAVDTLRRHARRSLGKFINERTRRRPAVIPVVMEV